MTSFGYNMSMETPNLTLPTIDWTSPHNRFDLAVKQPARNFPDDVLRFLMGRDDIEFLEHLQTDFPTVEVRYMDTLIKVRIGGEPTLIHCEYQLDDSSPVPMVQRNVGYLGRCFEIHGLPIYSHVIYMRPTAGLKDPGGYRQNVPGYRFILEYKVIRLGELEGESLVEAPQAGLMPFAPLMKPPVGMDSVEWLRRCVQTTQELQLEAPTKGNVLVTMGFLGNVLHSPATLNAIMPRALMQESTYYHYLTKEIRQESLEQGLQQGLQRGLQQGREEGERKGTLNALLRLLEARFEPEAAHTLKPFLETIEDSARLERLVPTAAQAPNLQTFLKHLAE